MEGFPAETLRRGEKKKSFKFRSNGGEPLVALALSLIFLRLSVSAGVPPNLDIVKLD